MADPLVVLIETLVEFFTKNQEVRQFLRRARRILNWSVLGTLLIATFIIFHNSLLRAHLSELCGNAWATTLLKTSQTNISVVLFLVAAPIAFFVAGMFVHPREHMSARVKESILPAFIGLLVPLCGLGIVFLWSLAHADYEQHQESGSVTNNLRLENSVLSGEREKYKQVADRVPGLEQQVNDLRKKLGEKPQVVTRRVEVPIPTGQDAAELVRIQKEEQQRREKRKAIRQIIASDISLGNNALDLLYNKGLSDEDVNAAVQAWGASTEKHLRDNLGDDYVVRFRSVAGINGMSPTNTPPSEVRQKLWFPIYFRLVRLNQFLEELKD